MPRYVTGHNIACLTRQGVHELANLMRSSTEAGFLRFLVSLTEGQLIAEFDVASRPALEAWMKKSGKSLVMTSVTLTSLVRSMPSYSATWSAHS